jgi:hypothetical protein
MMTNIKELISEIADILQFHSDESDAYLDLTDQSTQILEYQYFDTKLDSNEFNSSPKWIQDCIIAAQNHELVPIECLPSHEAFDIMSNFIDTVNDKNLRTRLIHDLNSRHPFSAFNSSIRYMNLVNEWHKFHDEAYLNLAINWISENGLTIIDDKIVKNR